MCSLLSYCNLWVYFFVDYLPNINTQNQHSITYVIVSTLFTLLIGLCVIIKHRSNIQRLLNGTEKKITAKNSSIIYNTNN